MPKPHILPARTLMLAALLVASPATSLGAQSVLATPFNSNNGGFEGGVVFFNLHVNSQLTVAALDVNVDQFTGPGVQAGLSVWFVPFSPPATGYPGREHDAAYWGAASSTAAFVTGAEDTPTFAPLETPVLLDPGDYAVAIVAQGWAHSYTDGTGSTLPGGGATPNTTGGFNQHAVNADLEIYLGAASNNAFPTATSGAVFEPRVANVGLHYGLGAGLIAALARPYGTGCYQRPTSFYEDFTPGQIDLSGIAGTSIQSIRLTPNGQGGYAVGQGSNLWSDQTGNLAPGALPASPPLPSGDDAIDVIDLSLLAPGFQLTNVPGALGPQGFLYVCSNGFVSTSAAIDTSYTPTATDLLAREPRWAVAWSDYEPNAQGSVHFDYDGTNCYVTWHDVPSWGNAGSSFCSFQLALLPNGVIEYRWEQLDSFNGEYVIGFSTGRGATDPGATDLSFAAPLNTLNTGPGSLAPKLRSNARALGGQTLSLVTSDIEAIGVFGAVLASFTDIPTGIDLNLIGVPAAGCRAFIDVSQNASLGLNLTLGQPTFTTFFPIPSGLSGLQLFCQSLVFAPGANTANVIVSNGLELRVGGV